MIHRGHVNGGMIVLEAPGELPEGAAVDVKLAEQTDQGDPLDPAFLIGDLAVDLGDPALSNNLDSDAVARRMDAGTVSGGIPDLAANHDHYLYGHPKVEGDPGGQGRPPVPGDEGSDDPQASDLDPGGLMLKMLDFAGPTGIPDLARNIDHYLYGNPKGDDGG